MLSPATQSTTWRDLYLQALFETDKKKIRLRILKAEQALIAREHELFRGLSSAGERDAVNNALHALQVLKNCLPSRNQRLAA
jgi:hypothetical protein